MLAISPTSSIVKPPSAALTATRSIRPRRISIPSDRLRSGLRIRESLLETTDFLSIDCVGMKSRSRRWRTRNLRLTCAYAAQARRVSPEGPEPESLQLLPPSGYAKSVEEFSEQ